MYRIRKYFHFSKKFAKRREWRRVLMHISKCPLKSLLGSQIPGTAPSSREWCPCVRWLYRILSLSLSLLISMRPNPKISFTLYFAHSRVGRGNLVLRHSFPHLPPNSGGIAWWVAELRALPRHQSEEMEIFPI